MVCVLFFFFKQKAAYEMRISDWSSDVCSSDLLALAAELAAVEERDWLASLEQAHELLVVQTVWILSAAEAVSNTDNLGVATVVADENAHHVASNITIRSACDLDAERLCLGVDAGVAECNAEVDCNTLRGHTVGRSEEHTSELQSLMRISYAVFC